MRFFLAKSEPGDYSISDLARDGQTKWDGVHNHQALRVIKSWQPGDLVFIYHSMGEARIVGLAQIVSEPQPDPDDERGFSWYADVQFVREFPEEHKISLKEIKQSHLFDEWSLVKQSRLSTMECPQEFIDWLIDKGLNLTVAGSAK